MLTVRRCWYSQAAEFFRVRIKPLKWLIPKLQIINSRILTWCGNLTGDSKQDPSIVITGCHSWEIKVLWLSIGRAGKLYPRSREMAPLLLNLFHSRKLLGQIMNCTQQTL